MEKDKYEGARANAEAWLGSIGEMVEAVNNDDNREAAERTIHESVRSIQVRGGWHSPGDYDEGPDEYAILLTTMEKDKYEGARANAESWLGPALRIWGTLGKYYEPNTAELQMQDWGLPWSRYPAPEALLLDFARRFYFGGC